MKKALLLIAATILLSISTGYAVFDWDYSYCTITNIRTEKRWFATNSMYRLFIWWSSFEWNENWQYVDFQIPNKKIANHNLYFQKSDNEFAKDVYVLNYLQWGSIVYSFSDCAYDENTYKLSSPTYDSPVVEWAKKVVYRLIDQNQPTNSHKSNNVNNLSTGDTNFKYLLADIPDLLTNTEKTKKIIDLLEYINVTLSYDYVTEKCSTLAGGERLRCTDWFETKIAPSKVKIAQLKSLFSNDTWQKYLDSILCNSDNKECFLVKNTPYYWDFDKWLEIFDKLTNALISLWEKPKGKFLYFNEQHEQKRSSYLWSITKEYEYYQLVPWDQKKKEQVKVKVSVKHKALKKVSKKKKK